jgi:D-tyrosyl-tRNA(Tyr) deacylase
LDGVTVGAIGRGFLILVGATHADGRAEAEWLARKVAGLRIFEDDAGKMNLGLSDVGGSLLVVSQLRCTAMPAGRRPASQMPPARNKQSPLDYFASRLREGSACGRDGCSAP